MWVQLALLQISSGCLLQIGYQVRSKKSIKMNNLLKASERSELGSSKLNPEIRVY